MTKLIEFYFDFISPYSYLAHKQIQNIQKEKKIKFLYKPILLGGLHNLIGITAPAFINSKAKFMIRDCKIISKKFNIKFKFNPLFPINSLNLLRGLIGCSSDRKNSYIDNFFNAYWQDSLNLKDERIIFEILKKIKVRKSHFLKSTTDPIIKDKLRNLTHEAFKKDIFGAPTFLINNKIFWGQDRLEFALDEYNK
ncbi:2-hydroxychromene-2-carboxylate isomerase [Candidatus Pelagibacter sp.]|nr:2-hydroxychromene-2-carboxylate isomerase [Candidatus Pelagibacter sp.]